MQPVPSPFTAAEVRRVFETKIIKHGSVPTVPACGRAGERLFSMQQEHRVLRFPDEDTIAVRTHINEAFSRLTVGNEAMRAAIREMEEAAPFFETGLRSVDDLRWSGDSAKSLSQYAEMYKQGGLQALADLRKAMRTMEQFADPPFVDPQFNWHKNAVTLLYVFNEAMNIWPEDKSSEAAIRFIQYGLAACFECRQEIDAIKKAISRSSQIKSD
jgi:hypothetical protein